jgi:hypothetical protein
MSDAVEDGLLIEKIKQKLQSGRVVQVNGNLLTFEGTPYEIEQQKANTTVNTIVSLNGLPVDIQRAYAIVLTANAAWLHALAEARARTMTQETTIADLRSEIQQLRQDV